VGSFSIPVAVYVLLFQLSNEIRPSHAILYMKVNFISREKDIDSINRCSINSIKIGWTKGDEFYYLRGLLKVLSIIGKLELTNNNSNDGHRLGRFVEKSSSA